MSCALPLLTICRATIIIVIGVLEDEVVAVVATSRIEDKLTTADKDSGTAMLLGVVAKFKETLDDDGITADEDAEML